MLARSFVGAAVSRARMKNGRINQSRVAAMTGLSRTEVRHLVARSSSIGHQTYGAQRLLEGWSRDSEFSTGTGSTKRLPLHGGYGSFPRLAKKYGADIPHKAILDELRRLGAVRVSKGFVEQRLGPDSTVRKRVRAISQGALHLSALFRSFGYPSTSAPQLTLADEVTIELPDKALLQLAQNRVEQGAKAFLHGLATVTRYLAKGNASAGNKARARLLVRISVSKVLQDDNKHL